MPKIRYISFSAKVTHFSTVQSKTENGFDVWVNQTHI